jgi:hypothetical protein
MEYSAFGEYSDAPVSSMLLGYWEHNNPTDGRTGINNIKPPGEFR